MMYCLQLPTRLDSEISPHRPERKCRSAGDIRNLAGMFLHGRTFAVCYVLAACAHIRLTAHGTVTA
jgi:hypothetical protein